MPGSLKLASYMVSQLATYVDGFANVEVDGFGKQRERQPRERQPPVICVATWKMQKKSLLAEAAGQANHSGLC